MPATAAFRDKIALPGSLVPAAAGGISTVSTLAEPATPPPVQTVAPNELEMQRALAAELMKSSQQPVGHWTQGVANIADALVGGLTARKAGERETAALESENAADAFAASQGGGLLARMLMGEQPTAEELSGVLSNPRAGGYATPIMDMMKPKAGEGYTLGPGETRFEGGKAVATVPSIRSGEGYTLSPGQVRYDAEGNPIAGVPGEPDTDADIAEFQEAKDAGLIPPEVTYEEFKRYGKAETNFTVSTVETADVSEAKKKGEARVARFAAIAEDLPAADSLSQSINRLDQLLEGVDPGTEAAAVNWVRDMTGLELTEGAGKLQAVQSMIDYLTPRMRVPGSGATSDMEMRIFKNALPGLMGTPDGNRIIIETLKGLAERRVDMANIASDYLNDTLTAEEATKQMRSLPDPFAAFKGSRGEDTLSAPAPTTTPPVGDVKRDPQRVRNDSEYDALPSGTEFIGPDGVRRRKP